MPAGNVGNAPFFFVPLSWWMTQRSRALHGLVQDSAARTGATSFDAPGARYTHRDGLCSFEVLIEDNGLGSDPALALMARVVHGADVSEDADATPQSPGLQAIADGFALLEIDDLRQLELELPVYDALYAWARREVAGAG